MKLEVSCGRWIFTGRIPMELARKSWGDRYAAVRAAEKAGYIVLATGVCVLDEPTRPARLGADQPDIPGQTMDGNTCVSDADPGL